MSERKLLIVDDEEIIRNVFKTVLESEKFEVFIAGDGKKAQDILSEHLIPVVFIDLMMPGMNGIDLCRKIKEINKDALCFAITGNILSLKLPEFKEAGFEDYLKKPVKMSRLVELANEAFNILEQPENAEAGT